MSFGTILFVLILGGGLAILSFRSFRRGVRDFGEMRTSTTRQAAKTAFTSGGFYLFVGMLLAILLLIVTVVAFAIYPVGDSADGMS